jgi:hypothetical protein
MKIKSLFVAVLLMGGVLVAPAQAATENPVVNSFTFTPQEIDLQATNTNVTFELVVSHPSGIENITVGVSATNGTTFTYGTVLTRVTPDASSTTATFKGSLTFSRTVPTGVYSISATTVKNNSTAGYQYGTGTIVPKNFRTLIGAESGLLVRSGGNLNFEYSTIAGPSYNPQNANLFLNKAKYNSQPAPIWRVGESIKISDYFELQVPGLQLSASSANEKICTISGDQLKFLEVGSCDYKVFTAATKDYAKYEINDVKQIQSARIMPTLAINKITNQDVKDLGKSIEIGRVYSPSEGWVLPQSATPMTCFAIGFYVKLIAGGTCKLTYQTAATETYLPSDLYTISFEILKDGQPVVVPVPVVTPTATPTPTPTVKPVVKKTITCTKGTKSVKRTGTAPKCPKGYKLKK